VKQDIAGGQLTKVTSVTEFATPNGKVVACEVALDNTGFALILDPEDFDFREAGAGWEYCKTYGLPQLGSLIITFEQSK